MTPAPTQAIGPDVDGVPATIDGETVFMGQALRAEIKGRASDDGFLAGGWFRNGDGDRSFCTLFDPPPQFNTCRQGFNLHDGRTGPWAIRLAINDPPRFDLGIARQNRPVVLRLHTHDPGCGVFYSLHPRDCAVLPVLDAMVWLGDVATEPPVPTPAATQPTGGLTRSEAIERARREVSRVGGLRLPVACTEVVLHSESLGGVLDDRDPWLWIVVFERDALHNAVVMDYATGEVLEYHGGRNPQEPNRQCEIFAGGIG